MKDIVHYKLTAMQTADVIQESTNVSGRRLIDIVPFVESIQKLDSHSNSCNFSNMRLVKEYKQGLNSILTFECTVCKYIADIKTNPQSNHKLEVNYASVLASYAVVIGFYQSEEFFGALDVPFMAAGTYDNRQKRVQNDLHELATSVKRDAMNEEKRVASERKEVDVNGTPLIAAYVDGSYPKRSYRTHYDSLSGAACMIGDIIALNVFF